MEIIQSEKNKKIENPPTKQHPRKLYNNTKWSNIHKTGVPKQRISAENLFEEIMPERFPNLVKEMFRDPRGSANPTRIHLKKKKNADIYIYHN